jgi:gluconate:H+ symporter, GntP family
VLDRGYVDYRLFERWQIELFFKAIKQNLKIKTFVGALISGHARGVSSDAAQCKGPLPHPHLANGVTAFFWTAWLLPASICAVMSPTYWPFITLAVSVAFIIIGIGKLRLHAFVALITAALIAGLMTGKESWDIVQKDGSVKTYSSLVGTVEMVAKGLGDTARDIAISIALAAIIGMALMQSGGADKVVRRFLAFFGEKRAGWALLWSTFILSTPIFFDTMFMLMAPLAMTLALRTGGNYVLYVMAVCCAGTLTHGLTVPHPGPVAVVDDLKISAGLSLVWGMGVGAIVAAIGFMFSHWLNKGLVVPVRGSGAVSLESLRSVSDKPESELPSFFWSITPVVLPILLISLTTVFELGYTGANPKSGEPVAWAVSLQNLFGGASGFSAVRTWVDFIGNKNIALFIGAAIAVGVLARQCKLGLGKLEEMVGPPLETAGMIILITSAGGAFGLALRSAGVGDAVKSLAQGYSINLILLGWLVAVVIRVAQGSATVAMLTASSIMVPMVLGGDLGCHPVYLFMSIGFGAMFCSWMNDSGFWAVSKLSGMTEGETLRTLTLQLTFNSIIGLLVVLLLSKVLPMV